jgi:hypothetical protein
MPCDNRLADEAHSEYIDILNEIRQIVFKVNADYLLCGGDFNTDVNRSSPHTTEFKQFVHDLDLSVCIEQSYSNIPFTFINHRADSKIDHFLISEALNENVKMCCTLDVLHSDHVPVVLEVDISLLKTNTIERPNMERPAWYKATDADITKYKSTLHELLQNIDINNELITCKDVNCKKHSSLLCDLYLNIINCCIEASKCIPTTKSNQSKVIPGWNDNVRHLYDEAMSWHHVWKAQGRPHDGTVASMRRLTRARYHKAVRTVKRQSQSIRMSKMGECISNNNSRDLWKEVKRIKGRNSVLPNNIDDVSGDDDISEHFAFKYNELYNSVPYDYNEMQSINDIVAEKVKNTDALYNVNVDDVIKAISKLKHGKGDGAEGLYSDHFIHAPHILYVYITMVFNAMLVHGICPHSMLLGTMVPIPKNRKKSICLSDNYRAIALSSIFGKIFDKIVLLKEDNVLCTSALQFGFKTGLSTTHCTYTMLETVDYYNFKHSNVYCLMLDATKAFDRIKYCKLFSKLLQREMSPVLLRLLIFMYTNQTLQVRWGSCTSHVFNATNGVKQGAVLSPVLFAVYMDDLLNKLQNSGYGCYVGPTFAGALAFADDITLLAPSITSMKHLVSICEQYAKEFDVKFNGAKSQLMLFRGRECHGSNKEIVVNNISIACQSNASHLGHFIDVNNRSQIIVAAKRQFWKFFNLFMSDFGNAQSNIKSSLFTQFCCSFYGAPLWPLLSKEFDSLCVAWRKSLRQIWRVPQQTHCDIIALLANYKPLHLQIQTRFSRFIDKCFKHTNIVVKNISLFCIMNPMSFTGRNYRNCFNVFTRTPLVPQHVNTWNRCCNSKMPDINVLKELINIRDGVYTCDILTTEDLHFMIQSLCTD